MRYTIGKIHALLRHRHSVIPEAMQWEGRYSRMLAPSPVFAKSATRFLRFADPTRQRKQNGKVRVALLYNFAEYFHTHRGYGYSAACGAAS